MGSKWPLVTVEDIATVKSGKRLPKDNELVEFVTAHPYIRLVDVSEGKVRTENLKYLQPETQKKISRYIVNTGDVCLAIVGHTIGMVFYIGEEWDSVNLTENAARITEVSSEFNSQFIYYYLNSSVGQNDILSRKVGSAQGKLPLYNIKSLEIPAPPKKYQDQVVKILGALDKKIELNRQTNQTLEQMAQTLFKSWFVDFDPVFDNLLAKANYQLENLPADFPEELQSKAAKRLAALRARIPTLEHGNEGLVSGNEGLASENAALPHPEFPSAFEFNGQLGWVPLGWTVGISGDLIDVRDGTHASPKKSEEGFPLVTSRHITSGTLDLSTTYLISEADYIKVNERSNVDSGDILLTMIGTVGIPYLVVGNPVNYAIKNIGLFKTSKSNNLKNYFYYLLKSPSMQNYLNARMAGTTQKYLSLKVLRNIEFLLPDIKTLKIFDDVIDGFSLKSKSNLEQIHSLTKLRDTLLPKLITGEIYLDN